MSFGEKLRELRKRSGLSQEELAEKIGVSRRSLIYYEQGKAYPSRPETITAIADVFGITTDELYSDRDRFVSEAAAAGGARARQSAQEVIDNMCALFAGGELSNEDKEEAMHIVMEAYLRSREKNKRFTPKKYRDGE